MPGSAAEAVAALDPPVAVCNNPSPLRPCKRQMDFPYGVRLPLGVLRPVFQAKNGEAVSKKRLKHGYLGYGLIHFWACGFLRPPASHLPRASRPLAKFLPAANLAAAGIPAASATTISPSKIHSTTFDSPSRACSLPLVVPIQRGTAPTLSNPERKSHEHERRNCAPIRPTTDQ
jgi:hypothetical protein